jgi:16S rRNA (adenine1518-N6/adenine1519-N6)-dimethyltransferase
VTRLKFRQGSDAKRHRRWRAGVGELLHWRAVAPQRLGQHFLASAAWRERIARLVLGANAPAARSKVAEPEAASRREDLWVEIGAGHGEMTSLLAAQVGRLIAIELDPRLLPRLQEQTAQLSNVTLTAGDVLALDLAELTEGERFRAYGNLPYYITSPIVHRLLAQADRLEAAFLVVQLEVAERMMARPGSRDFAYFSAFTQFYSRPEILLRIPPGAFQPPPKVYSALVALHLPGERAKLGISDEAGFLRFLKVCFAQKRKTLRNNLRSLMPQDEAAALLRECGIAPSARAEEIGLAEFARMFAATKPT